MIPLSEINNAAKKYNVSAEVIEKDYVITWILNTLVNSVIKNNFIFYGETAIKRVYFSEHRFSEDIDLISSKFYTKDLLIEYLKCIDEVKEKVNIELAIDNDKIISHQGRVILFINYSCHEEITGAPKEIQIDFNMRADIVGDYANKNIIQNYSDMNAENNIQLKVMTLNSILANKLGILFDTTRNEPRDIYDIWFLLQRIEQFDFDLERVLEICKEKYGIKLSFTLLNQHLNKISKSSKWELRLAKQLSELPELKLVISDINSILEKLFNIK